MAYTAPQFNRQTNQANGQFNGKGGRRRNWNPNSRRNQNYCNKPNKPQHQQKDVDGNITMGGTESAAPGPFSWVKQGPNPDFGNRRRRRNWKKKSGPRGPLPAKSLQGQNLNGVNPSQARPEPTFWEKVNWEPKDIIMWDSPAPAEWSQYSYTNTNGLKTQIDFEGDVVMDEAPSLTMTLLTELTSLMSVRS